MVKEITVEEIIEKKYYYCEICNKKYDKRGHAVICEVMHELEIE